MDRPVICLADIGTAVKIEAVARMILASLSEWIDRFETLGFRPIRDAWLAAGHRPGHPITVTRGNARLEGTFADIAEDGARRLRCGNLQIEGCWGCRREAHSIPKETCCFW